MVKKTRKMISRPIDITPSWKQAAMVYIRVLEDGTPKGKESGREGLLEMADKFDKVIKVLKLKKKGRIAKLKKVM